LLLLMKSLHLCAWPAMAIKLKPNPNQSFALNMKIVPCLVTYLVACIKQVF